MRERERERERNNESDFEEHLIDDIKQRRKSVFPISKFDWRCIIPGMVIFQIRNQTKSIPPCKSDTINFIRIQFVKAQEKKREKEIPGQMSG
jgi:hypothetical protein